tara:strand:+ start:405 stop:1310 length:906 start_codon:yes stop_codon:yes gene_type:complete
MVISPHIHTLLREFMTHSGVLPDRGTMPVPFPVADFHIEYDKSDPRLAAAPLRRISLDQIHATQRTIEADNVRNFIQDASIGGPPIVQQVGDVYAIVDGHHRLSAARMRGETEVEVHVVEDAPAMAAGNGGVAGLGVGAQGEPGVDLRKKRLYHEAVERPHRIATSKEHNADFWQIGDEVYRATRGAGLDSWGAPMGKRWECSFAHWQRYRVVYNWAVDLKTHLKEDAHDRFADADVFDVDSDKLHSVVDTKKPWERYSKYVGVDEDGENIRAHARKNWKRNIILRDSRTGAMRFLRKRRG